MAESQYLWHVVHTDFDGTLYYAFDAISCAGNNCTVCGSIIDPLQPVVTRMFWRSIDGGVSWQMQNPGIASYPDLKHKHYFTTIQEIDSINTIAGGDSGYVVRTFDGGSTWQKEDLHSNGIIRDIHFSDANTGIILIQEDYQILTGAGAVKILTTTNGGIIWATSSFTVFNPNLKGNFASCFSYGGGKFSVFSTRDGRIYSTNDNWQTIDSSNAPPNHSQEDSIYYAYNFLHCKFTRGDTIIAFGYYSDTANSMKFGGLMIRTINAGVTWDTPQRFAYPPIADIEMMTSLEGDTILASNYYANTILRSIDHGNSWTPDPFKLDTNYSLFSINSMTFSANSTPLAILGSGGASVYGVPTIIVRGSYESDGIEQINLPPLIPHLYPNPASDILHLTLLDPLRPIHIIDIFGRDMFRSSTDEQGMQTINISSIPRGMYNVLLDRDGKLLSAGKIVVVGK